MALRRKFLGQHDESSWAGILRIVWVALLGIGCYCIGEQMVQHYFFQGGALNYQLSRDR